MECFCLPEAVGKVNTKDEQFCKLLASVKESMGSEPIQMLNYGAGKFSIWECLKLLPDYVPGKNNMVYTAYELYPGESENKSFKLYTGFKDINVSKQRLHVVVLMNVLYEIEAGQWEQTFQDIYNVLADDNVLVFLEVISLAKGEQPYGNDGYLVLQDTQVEILFDDKNIVNMRKEPMEKSNCWMITREQVGKVQSKP